MLILGFSSALAQYDAGDQPQDKAERFEDAGSEKPAPETRQEQIEKGTDIREAILENLDISQVVDDSGEEEEVSPPLEGGQISQEEEELSPVEDEEQWYERFAPLITRMQEVPVLSDRGWLHFGRVEVEYGHFWSSDLLSGDSGFNLRSLRSGLVKIFDNGTIVKLDVDLTDGDSNFTDMYVRFSTRLGLFTLGNQKVAQSLVNQTSRLARTFMEEPLPAEAFGLVRRLGVGWDFHRKRVGVHLTAFGPDLNEQIGKFGYGARMYTSPTWTRWSMAHIGVSAVRESMDRDARYWARPESRLTETRLVDTGEDADVDTQTIFGLELAFAHRNWSVRGEYFYTEWDREIQEDTAFSGYYLQANWVWTGESFQYQQGKFLRIRPDSSRGAWEVALRYSTVDLNDLNVLGGEERNVTLALNWYGPGNQLRVQSNLIYVETDSVAGNEDPLIFQVRVQVHW
jgi:phosphate-selective porin OprO/OprP